jgi:hypothetical protein
MSMSPLMNKKPAKKDKYQERKVTREEAGAWSKQSIRHSKAFKENVKKFGNNGANAIKRMWEQKKAMEHVGKYTMKELVNMSAEAEAKGFVVKRYNPDGSVKV